MTWLPVLLGVLLGLARGQDDVIGVAAEDAPSSQTTRAMVETLRQDPGVADSLASRILRSGIGERISGAADPAQRLAEIRKWVLENPESAAQVAIGLSRDDEEGSRRFESAVLRNTSRSFQVNADHVSKSTFGRLKDSSVKSKLMGRDAEMSEEEKREILKSMFEGQGGMSNQIVNQAEDNKDPAAAAGAVGGAGLAGAYYDRLSGLNLRGYSPQVMAIQSALNQRRAPGAPKLVETGKLDYETLSYPAYGMRYDLRNLEARLRFQRNFALARLAGLEKKYRPEQLLEPEVEALLLRKAAGAKTSPRFDRRRAALERAAAALARFAAAAEPAKDPRNLSRGLLLALGSAQKDAARWITVAALEEELQRLESEGGFLTPELKAVIAACPAPPATRAAYLRRGAGFAAAWDRMKANAEQSLRRLEADDWQAAAAAVGAAQAENAALRKDLGRNIQDFVDTPYRLRGLSQDPGRWRRMLDDAVERVLPGSQWGRRLRQRSVERATLLDVFDKIAAGSLDAAHTILSAGAPSAPAR